jgi:curved DNA-binding protein CbpA
MRQTTTLYDILGVEQQASEKDIRAAFRRLTLKHHPDRFSGEERARAEKQFQTLTEAFNVLSNPEARQRYDRDIANRSPNNAAVMDRTEIARRLASKGAQAFKDGKGAEAVESLRLAIDHDDNCSRGHYFLGLALTQTPGRQRDALRHVERASVLEPNNVAIKVEAAGLFLQAGMRARAERFAAEALELDPTNSRAREVMQELTGAQKPQGDGFLGRLKRKG